MWYPIRLRDQCIDLILKQWCRDWVNPKLNVQCIVGKIFHKLIFLICIGLPYNTPLGYESDFFDWSTPTKLSSDLFDLCPETEWFPADTINPPPRLTENPHAIRHSAYSDTAAGTRHSISLYCRTRHGFNSHVHPESTLADSRFMLQAIQKKIGVIMSNSDTDSGQTVALEELSTAGKVMKDDEFSTVMDAHLPKSKHDNNLLYSITIFNVVHNV